MMRLACVLVAGCSLERGSGLIELSSEQHTNITQGEGAAAFFAQPLDVIPALGLAPHPHQVVGPCSIVPKLDDAAVSSGGDVQAFIDTRPVSFATVYSVPDPLFHGGETIEITTRGGDAPPIDGTLLAPHAGTLMQPSAPAVQVPRDDLVLTWRDVIADDVAILVQTDDAWTMSCVFDAAPGAGTIPAAALALVPAPQATFYVHVETSVALTAKNYDIVLRASTHPSRPDGSEAGFRATFD